jgi:16S rRNA (cytidine1402-2'-O)-methyltransferase
MSSGRFVLVPTPIGNAGDITLRAVEVLKESNRIACEDTRHSAPLLSKLGITGKPLVSLHEHNEVRRLPELLDAVRGGETVAVVTDAGMPAVSDPGYRVVQACIEQGIPFEVLPGPSAVLTALVGSGFPVHAFRFLGFLPIKKGKRLSVLEESLAIEGTSIFFESPHRLLSTLELLAEKHPDAPCCVARELTKKFETYHRGNAAELFTHFQAHPPKGEIVFLVKGP